MKSHSHRVWLLMIGALLALPDALRAQQGACCLPNGNCVTDTEKKCLSRDGNFLGDGVPCTPEACASPAGACCTDAGCVGPLTQAECQDAFGDWLGGGTTCTVGACEPAACCLEDSTCVEARPLDCAALNGTLHAGEACLPTTCLDPLGACCFEGPTGPVCADNVPQSVCESAGRNFAGAGSVCADDPCGAIPACETCPADLNGDTLLDARDIQPFVDCLIAAQSGPPTVGCGCADMNDDAVVTLEDIDVFVEAMLNSDAKPCN